jgi:hypothetical protein
MLPTIKYDKNRSSYISSVFGSDPSEKDLFLPVLLFASMALLLFSFFWLL